MRGWDRWFINFISTNILLLCAVNICESSSTDPVSVRSTTRSIRCLLNTYYALSPGAHQWTWEALHPEWASTWHIWQWVRVWCLIKHVRTKVQREETTFPRSQSKGVTEVQPRIADPSPGWGDYLKHGTAQEKEVWSEWSVISIGLLAQRIWLALGVPLRTARGFWSSLW